VSEAQSRRSPSPLAKQGNLRESVNGNAEREKQINTTNYGPTVAERRIWIMARVLRVGPKAHVFALAQLLFRFQLVYGIAGAVTKGIRLHCVHLDGGGSVLCCMS
jgi:hypothetical protein